MSLVAYGAQDVYLTNQSPSEVEVDIIINILNEEKMFFRLSRELLQKYWTIQQKIARKKKEILLNKLFQSQTGIQWKQFGLHVTKHIEMKKYNTKLEKHLLRLLLSQICRVRVNVYKMGYKIPYAKSEEIYLTYVNTPKLIDKIDFEHFGNFCANEKK